MAWRPRLVTLFCPISLESNLFYLLFICCTYCCLTISLQPAVSKILELPENQEVAVVGTIYKEMKLKPSILSEYNKVRHHNRSPLLDSTHEKPGTASAGTCHPNSQTCLWMQSLRVRHCPHMTPNAVRQSPCRTEA